MPERVVVVVDDVVAFLVFYDGALFTVSLTVSEGCMASVIQRHLLC